MYIHTLALTCPLNGQIVTVTEQCSGIFCCVLEFLPFSSYFFQVTFSCYFFIYRINNIRCKRKFSCKEQVQLQAAGSAAGSRFGSAAESGFSQQRSRQAQVQLQGAGLGAGSCRSRFSCRDRRSTARRCGRRRTATETFL